MEPRALCEDVGSGFEVGVTVWVSDTVWVGVLQWEEPLCSPMGVWPS